MTRKEQVLERLRQSLNIWIDGPDLANEAVGGSEGHRRIRELREDGYDIVKRRHPDPKRDIWQYTLRRYSNEVLPIDGPKWKTEWTCETCGHEPFDRPQVLFGSVGLAKCATCGSRRYFRERVA